MKQPNSTFCVCGVTRQINGKHFGLSHLSLFFKSYFFRKKVPKSLFFQQHGFPVEDEKARQIHFVRGFINFVSRCVSFSRLKIKVNET